MATLPRLAAVVTILVALLAAAAAAAARPCGTTACNIVRGSGPNCRISFSSPIGPVPCTTQASLVQVVANSGSLVCFTDGRLEPGCALSFTFRRCPVQNVCGVRRTGSGSCCRRWENGRCTIAQRCSKYALRYCQASC